MYLTEDKIPVRTIYIPNVSIYITNQMLCDYFRQFGAIERVQIVPERLKFSDIFPAFGANRYTDNNFRNSRKYFAYVTFVNCLGACDALNQNSHEIQNDKLLVEQAFSWHQPGVDDAVRPVFSDEYFKLYANIERSLNDDCIIQIMSFLSLSELINVAKFSPRFLFCAQQQRKLMLVSGQIDVDGLTLMHLRRILRLQGFGQTIRSLTLSSKVFRSFHKSNLFNRLVQYIGPQLASLSLRSFNVTSEEFDQLKPLLQQLTYLEIDLNYEFNYEKLNDKWPNLEILRIRTAGLIQLIGDSAKSEYPKLQSLQLITSYKLHENLFDCIATNFSKIYELVIIMLDDYYSELTQAVPLTDFQNLHKLRKLSKLHLSVIRTYFSEAVIEAIADVTTLTHLSVDVTNCRNTVPVSETSISDRNFISLVRSLQNLEECRLSGLQMTSEKITQIVQNLIYLNELVIHNCHYYINANVINEIVPIRSRQQSNRAEHTNIFTLKPLTIIAEETPDFEMDERLADPEVSNYVVLKKTRDSNIINEKYDVNPSNAAKIYRTSYRRRINEFLPRDLNRLRNRLFMFNP